MFGAPTVVTIKIPVLWVVTPCSLVNVYGCFRRNCRLRRQENITRRHPAVGCVYIESIWTKKKFK
jgi:hypothetical protein